MSQAKYSINQQPISLALAWIEQGAIVWKHSAINPKDGSTSAGKRILINGYRNLIECLGNRGKFFDHEESHKHNHHQDIFRTYLHELMNAKTRVHNIHLTIQDA